MLIALGQTGLELKDRTIAACLNPIFQTLGTLRIAHLGSTSRNSVAYEYAISFGIVYL